MKCANCGKHEATIRKPWGYMPCVKCIERQRKFTIKETIEIVTEDIKEDRKKFEKDILQRYRGDTPNKRYIKEYGTKGFSKEEVKRAKDVYPSYYKDE